MAAIEQALGYTFLQPRHLHQALTHRSFGTPHNERLEFLGDSVLNCAIAHLLYIHFPDLPEGVLSRLRANLVRQQSLFEIALTLELGTLLKMGDGEVKSGGRNRPSILADGLESLFGAVFLDGGFAEAERVIHALYAPRLADIDPDLPAKDAKTLLQEILQSRKLPLPVYELAGTAGDAHAQTFRVTCSVPALQICTQGEAASRRAAEQTAARTAYNQIVAATKDSF
ncbi:MAG: ribonuclease III [Pseudomonadota bacterium]